MFLKIAALVSIRPGKTFATEEKRFETFPKTSKYILSLQEALHGMHAQLGNIKWTMFPQTNGQFY